MPPIQLIVPLLVLSSSIVTGAMLTGTPALASPRGQMYVPSYKSGGALLPDWKRITFEDFPAVTRLGGNSSGFNGGGNGTVIGKGN